MAKKKEYDADSIRQLQGLEAVRERIGMFLGDPCNGDALHHTVKEVVDNAVDEHLAGECTEILVALEPEGVVHVTDNGRGIPVGINKQAGLNTLEMVMCSLFAGGKFSKDSYEESAGLHGVGVSAVNAVSSLCEVTVARDGQLWHQKYHRGKPLTEVTSGGPADTRGTSVRWRRDLEIFSGVTEYSFQRIAEYLQELAFLNPGLIISLTDARGKKAKEVSYCYEGGIKTFVEELSTKKKTITPVMYFYDHLAHVSMVWTDASNEDIRCYANNVKNPDGGTHLSGFKAGLTKVVTKFAKSHGMLQDLKDGLQGSDIREGLIAVVSVRVKDLAFSSQTKDKLVSPSARASVEDLFTDQVDHWFSENPGLAKRIADRAVIAAKAREAARRAKAEVIKQNYQDPLSLPGKLADCQSKIPADCELYIVEGDSAGGTAKGGRDRRYQAILPLRGKVLNVERASLDALLSNEEIGTVITALGCGMEPTRNFELKKLRYHKIIILTDADVDGAHIRTLLLTLFYRCVPQLIWNGHVYIGQPPLYGARLTGTLPQFFFTDDVRLNEFRATLNPVQNKQLKLSRYKGLGEMNSEQLWTTTLDPETRTLKAVTVEDAIEAERGFDLLMGSEVDPRKEWIVANAQFADELDV